MRKIAIISINGASNRGGVERVVELHSQIFREHGALVRVVSLPSKGALGKAIRRSGVLRKLAIAIFPVFSPFVARWWAGRSGVVFSHGFSSIGLFCDVVFAHGCWAAFRKATALPRTLFSRMTFMYECLAARLADRVVAVSDVVAAAWNHYYGAAVGKVEVLYNSVDFERFRPQTIQSDLEHPIDVVRVLFVGRLEDAKGLDYLVRLCREIEASNEKEVTLRVCTPAAPSVTVCDALVGCDILVDLDSDAMALEYSRADLTLLPSRYEAFELCTLESLGCGTPVMLNDTGTRPSLLRLGCPGVYSLQAGESPLVAVYRARTLFAGLSRDRLAQWTRATFDYSKLQARLLAIAGL